MRGTLMLETCFNQGAGLQSLALQTGPRMIAMTNHGDKQSELSLLWNLCSTLVDLGYCVGVLDATTTESADNPGLEKLLNECSWSVYQQTESLPWSVIPAARGLMQLCSHKPAQGLPLAPLGSLFQNFGVVVIYAGADVLSQLLANSGIEPLLTVTSIKMSPVTAYQALKQLLLNAKLRPTMASIVSNPVSNRVTTAKSPIENLQECAMTFLGYRLDALAVRTHQPSERPTDDVKRLALRLLENALPLRRNHFVGSH